MKLFTFLLSAFAVCMSCSLNSVEDVTLTELKRSDSSVVRISWFATGPVGNSYIKASIPEISDSIYGSFELYDSLAYAALQSDTLLLIRIARKGTQFPSKEFTVKLPPIYQLIKSNY